MWGALRNIKEQCPNSSTDGQIWFCQQIRQDASRTSSAAPESVRECSTAWGVCQSDPMKRTKMMLKSLYQSGRERRRQLDPLSTAIIAFHVHAVCKTTAGASSKSVKEFETERTERVTTSASRLILPDVFRFTSTANRAAFEASLRSPPVAPFVSSECTQEEP